MNEHPLFGKIIHTCSTKDALQDGVLILADQKISREVGFRYPVYLTQAVEAKYVQVPRELSAEQDYEGRLWDIPVMAVFAATKKKDSGFCLDSFAACLTKGIWREMNLSIKITPG
ncbi:MAG TPA: hypothetical protein P5104_08800 [Bacteroidales bacterium]|mgnify:CR=1 FL=1|nr:hypothetical protein [Bacteroidales bacterium]